MKEFTMPDLHLKSVENSWHLLPWLLGEAWRVRERDPCTTTLIQGYLAPSLSLAIVLVLQA